MKLTHLKPQPGFEQPIQMASAQAPGVADVMRLLERFAAQLPSQAPVTLPEPPGGAGASTNCLVG